METNNLPSNDIHLATAANASDTAFQEGGFYRGKLMVISSHRPVDWPLFMAEHRIDVNSFNNHDHPDAEHDDQPKSPNLILSDRYQKGKRSRRSKQRRQSW